MEIGDRVVATVGFKRFTGLRIEEVVHPGQAGTIQRVVTEHYDDGSDFTQVIVRFDNGQEFIEPVNSGALVGSKEYGYG